MPVSPLLALDHVSVVVPSLSEAIITLDQQLGLTATVSPEDPDRHSRVFLDRSYIEVSADTEAPPWTAPLFFLRFEDPDGLRTHLEEVGLSFEWGEYTGVDGKWDDIELAAGTVPMPILVRRTEPVEAVRDWPPALTGTHRCGAESLAAIHVAVPDLEAARSVYARLLGSSPSGLSQIVLSEGAAPGVSGIVFQVRSQQETKEAFGDALSLPEDDGVAWLKLTEIPVRIGFTE